MSAPTQLCLLRLSALGDACNLLPVIATLRAQRPDWVLTWVIGKGEAKLLDGLEGVRLVAYDKKGGFAAWRALRRALADTHFDALLVAQLALRAGLLVPAIRARRVIGYPAARSKEGHGLFVRERAPVAPGRHVVDQWLALLQPLGIDPSQFVYDWPLPIPADAHSWARERTGAPAYFAISPCSSHALRNWPAERMAQVIDAVHQRYGLRPLLMGGRSPVERDMADAILQASRAPILDLVGRDTLKQSLALLAGARFVISPDSGPAHFASALNVPVIGLYAATDPQRSGPYRSRGHCVDAYAAAAQQFLNKPAAQLAWGQKIERPGVMELITVEQVMAKVDGVCGQSSPMP